MQQRNQRLTNYQPNNEWNETNNRGTDRTNADYSESDVQNSRLQQQQHYIRGGQQEGYQGSSYNDGYQGYNEQYDNKRGNQWGSYPGAQPSDNGYSQNQYGSRNQYGSQYESDNYSRGNQFNGNQQNASTGSEQYGRRSQYGSNHTQDSNYSRRQQYSDNNSGWENGGNTRENRYNSGGSQSAYNQNYGGPSTYGQDYGGPSAFGQNYGGASAYGQTYGQNSPQYGGQNSYGNATSYRGKGPKGYQRSDERITEEINDRLTDDHQLDASGIEVRVTNGEVKLTGSVPSREAKRRAEDLSESISGVANVENSIKVKQENSPSDVSAKSSYSVSEDGLKNTDKNKSTSKM